MARKGWSLPLFLGFGILGPIHLAAKIVDVPDAKQLPYSLPVGSWFLPSKLHLVELVRIRD